MLALLSNQSDKINNLRELIILSIFKEYEN